jgi:hypothetical protein
MAPFYINPIAIFNERTIYTRDKKFAEKIGSAEGTGRDGDPNIEQGI